jgi:pimeloyl-ACP methyl ester carboxylesterase
MRRLGYERYGAQGTDWGTSVSASLGQQDAEHVAGVHVMPPLAPPDPSAFDDLTERERDALSALEEGERDSGYNQVHETRPQTVGYGLVDSPAGLCAWIVEKLRAWSDEPLTRDQELDAVMLYWLPGTAASSARLYWESMGDVRERMGGTVTDTVEVPAGCTIWPKDNPRPSRRWAERRFTDIRHWSEPPRGGHFAALEQPELFVEEVRAFFSLVR